MKNQFVTYEISLKLKDLGFDETCFGIYLSGFSENEFNTASPQCLFSSKVFIDRQKTGGYCNSTSYATAAPLWQQTISWLKTRGVLVSELWDGWEIAKEDEDFIYYESKEDAILGAIEICRKNL